MQKAPYSLRIDEKLMDEIKKSACKNRRTVNKEIEMMLDYYINKVANKKAAAPAKPRKKKATKGDEAQAPTPTDKQPLICPLCHKGEVIQGKAAYGCSRWREGCGFRLPFGENGQPLDEATLRQRIQEYKPNPNTENHE